MRSIALTACWLLLFAANGLAYGIVINEVMADNDTTVLDQNGENDDWVELYNPSDTAVFLHSLYLSDRESNPGRWRLPDTTIGANSYLIVWADEDVTQAGLHASFKLSASGEGVFLFDSLLSLLDSVNFGVQTTDISYGRYPNGSGAFNFMYPTFSEENCGVNPGTADRSDEFFVDTLVHRFRLHFYIDHWADTLRVYYDNDENRYLPAQLTYNDTLVLDSIGVRYKGNSSYTMSSNTPKKPFEFKFNEFKDSQSLFGLHRLNVHNGMSDPSFMREAIAYGIARRYMPASRTTYADVYIDNELIGFYSIIEQMDKIFLARHFLSNGFNLYKAGNDGAPLAYRGTVQSLYESEYELKTNETENDWSRFIVMLDMLNNASDGEFVELAGEYLDFDSCLRLLAFNMVLSNFDSYSGSGRNYYFYDYETIGKFVMMPWDLNEAFGVYTNSWNVITQDIVGISNLNSRPLMRRLLENDSLRQIYQNYIATMIIEIAHADSVSAMVDRMQPVIQPHVLADNNKLYTNENFYNNLTSNVSVDIGRVIPGLKNFSRNRNASLVLQLTSERVYPGDCDNNGVVDASDVLPIGRYFQTTGSSRTTINVNWTAQRAPRWENVAAMFADANGDGTVDERDVVGIGVNWGNSHGNIMRSFPIDPGDAESIQPYRSDFHTLYRSLIGNDTAVVAMKTLLEMLFQFTTENRLPEEYSLSTNYPNPFNQSTLFRLALPEPHSVTVSVYNVLGQSIPALWERKQLTTGYHTLQLDARSLSNGIYFYRIEAGPYCAAKKFTVLK